jgi:hypothetical protein
LAAIKLFLKFLNFLKINCLKCQSKIWKLVEAYKLLILSPSANVEHVSNNNWATFLYPIIWLNNMLSHFCFFFLKVTKNVYKKISLWFKVKRTNQRSY